MRSWYLSTIAAVVLLPLAHSPANAQQTAAQFPYKNPGIHTSQETCGPYFDALGSNGDLSVRVCCRHTDEVGGGTGSGTLSGSYTGGPLKITNAYNSVRFQWRNNTTKTITFSRVINEPFTCLHERASDPKTRRDCEQNVSDLNKTWSPDIGPGETTFWDIGGGDLAARRCTGPERTFNVSVTAKKIHETSAARPPAPTPAPPSNGIIGTWNCHFMQEVKVRITSDLRVEDLEESGTGSTPQRLIQSGSEYCSSEAIQLGEGRLETTTACYRLLDHDTLGLVTTRVYSDQPTTREEYRCDRER
jgi:hypothetical protein